MSIEVAKKLLELTVELERSSAYWSEYDVPLGIHDRIAEAKTDCLAEIRAEIKSLEIEADTLVKFAGHKQGAKQLDLMEQSYAVREQAGLLQQWLDKVLSDE
jgi:hypothetical protein